MGVNPDESVRRHKGYLPLIRYANRARMVRACKYTRRVIKGNLIINTEQLKEYGVDIYILGTDWKYEELEGREEAIKAGIEIRYFPYTEGISTTIIKARIRGEEQ